MSSILHDVVVEANIIYLYEKTNEYKKIICIVTIKIVLNEVGQNDP